MGNKLGIRGNNLILETCNNYKIYYYYHYGEKNDLIGFKYNNQKYYYIRNIFKTIEKVIDSNGNIVISYQYDPYGKVIMTTKANNAPINHFLYKGYYYDNETEFYYLLNRYYYPEICRWISPDLIDFLDNQSIIGLNLYCYCANNPIMNIDPSGHVWYNPLTRDWCEIAKGVGLVITGVAAIAVGVVTLPYGGWIAAVAGVTILAGGGTVLFGLSDIGEGITDHNVIQEAVFMGNEDAYNLAENIFQYTAIAGTAICGIYGATHTTLSAARSTPRTGNAHSAIYNKQFNTLTYYGKNGQMKYSMHLFNRGHQWVHWHTELPHSQPINNFLRFVWEMAKRGF